MSGAFEAKMLGLVAAIFLTAVTIWVLYRHSFIDLFEVALTAASAIIIAALISIRMIKSNYTDVLEENNT
jgi:heme/copper-type cytochrome/quinol oxidase subunit 4